LHLTRSWSRYYKTRCKHFYQHQNDHVTSTTSSKLAPI